MSILECRDLTFRHARRTEPVLKGVDINIHQGDRILLEGESGGGKSTLASVLAGARTPSSGVRLLAGIDQPTLGEDLELGPLINRMPGGLLQMVGETGWQLSHGERSRLFLARALLQQSDVVILDESLAALDPVTISRILPRVTSRARSLMLIAHP